MRTQALARMFVTPFGFVCVLDQGHEWFGWNLHWPFAWSLCVLVNSLQQDVILTIHGDRHCITLHYYI
jgi:hypothetical protein